MLPGNQSGNDWAFPGAEGTLRGGPNIARRGIFGPGRPPRPSAGAAFQGYRGGTIQRGTRRNATALPSAPADGPSVIITSSRSSVLGNAPERSGERESEAGATLAPIPQGGVGSVLAVGGLYVQQEQSSGSRCCKGIRSYLFSAQAGSRCRLPKCRITDRSV